MITNERQYAITRAQAGRFREALEAEPPQGMHLKALKAMRAGTQSQLEELEEQLAEYEALTGYAGVSIEQLQTVVDAPDVRVNEVLTPQKK